MMKKILALLLVVALTASVAIAGTVAYLTVEEEPKRNVFTVGDLDISLDEEVGVFGEGGTVEKTTDEEGNVTGAEYTEIMPGDYLKKEVTITNNDTIDAYVAVTVTLNNANAINEAIDEYYEALDYTTEQIQAIYTEVFDGWGINYNPRPGVNGNDARGVIDGTHGLPEHVLHVDFTKTLDDYWLLGSGNWFIGADEETNKYWIDSWTGELYSGGYYAKNMDPNEICYTYYMLLPAGESSTLFNGLNVPAAWDKDQLAMFEGLVIDIQASAIQANNMVAAEQYADDENGVAKTAFAVLAGDIAQSELPAVDNDPVEEIPDDATIIDSAEDLLALSDKSVEGTIYLDADIDLGGDSIQAIAAGYGKKLTIIGNGHTISNATLAAGTHNGMDNYGLFYAYTDSTLNIRNLTIENITVDATSSNYGAAVVIGYMDGGSNVTLNNVDVKNCSVTNEHDEAAVYVSYQTGTLNMTNCDSKGCTVTGASDQKTGAFIGHCNGSGATLTNCTTDLTIGACNRVDGTLTVK